MFCSTQQIRREKGETCSLTVNCIHEKSKLKETLSTVLSKNVAI